MTEYSKVARRIWNSKTFSGLNDDAKFLWFYLLTCPHSNMVGLYILKTGYVLEDLNWSPQRFTKSFNELLSIQLTNGCRGLIKYDEQNKLLLIKNFLEHNPLKNPNQIIAAIKKIKELPFSPLFQELKLFTEQLNKQSPKQLYTPLVEQLGKPVTVTVTVTGEEEEIPQKVPPEPSEGIFLSIPLIDKTYFHVANKLIEEFTELYPAVDVKQALRDIKGWNISNPKKRKTPNGILKHINTWLAKAQDKSGGTGKGWDT